MSYVLYSADKVPMATGLTNRGATCWLNSILQLLFSLPALHQTATEFEHSGSRNKFLKLFNLLYREPANATHLANFHKYMIQAAGASTPTHLIAQECADEGYHMILNLFKNPQIQKKFATTHKVTFDCPACLEPTSRVRDMAYRIDLFSQGDLLTADKAPKITTQEQFQQYILTHLVELDEYTCDYCKVHSRGLQRTERLCQVHEILVFTFNKFYDKTKIWFPERFDIPFMRSGRPSRAHYRLTCHISHSGTMNGGHYWATGLRRADDNTLKWTTLNDTSISAGSPEPTPETFIIAYHMERIV